MHRYSGIANGQKSSLPLSDQQGPIENHLAVGLSKVLYRGVSGGKDEQGEFTGGNVV